MITIIYFISFIDHTEYSVHSQCEKTICLSSRKVTNVQETKCLCDDSFPFV